MRIYIIHGWSGSPDTNWIPWLASELQKQGYQVFAPAMPDTDNPVIEKWVNRLTELVGIPDKDTYFVGGSIGCQTIMRYLGTIDAPVGGAVFVAGWFNLENLETEEEKKIAEPWLTDPINIEKIKLVLPKSTLIISDNDPFGAFEENRKRFGEFVTKEIVLHGAGHIEEKCQEILDEVENLLK